MADVVGYSRLMERDETRTFSALKAQRHEVVDPAVARNHGRCIKLMGDGALFEFPSAVDAVSCAIDIQTALAERGRDSTGHDRDDDPDDDRIELRLGIHVGDVIVEGDDILGDAVNIASRLESLAEPGGVCLSQQAYDQVVHRIDLPFRELGARQVKNVARAVHAWAWSPPDRRRPAGIAPDDAARKTAPVRSRPSIAVLPFSNMSNDPAQEYFSDGITEDIITALSRCRWLTVIARNSTFAFKGRSGDVRRIADELNVRYVLEGSVRRAGERIRVTAQLIDGRDGAQLWGERYDRDLSDVLDLQDEIAGVLAGTIEPELSMIEGAALTGRATSDLDAWDCYQRGLWHLYRFTLAELERAKALFQRALTLDPSFAQACAQLAYAHIQLGWYGRWEDRPANIRDAIAFANRALSLDDREPAARVALGRALALAGKPERGLEELRIAVALDPSHAQAHFALGQVLCYLARPAEAVRELDTAIRLSPRDPHHWTFLNVRASAHYQAGDMDRAEADERAALRQPNATFFPALILVAVHGRQGKLADAAEAIRELHRFRPGYTRADARREWHFGEHAFMSERFIEQFDADLRAAGLPE